MSPALSTDQEPPDSQISLQHRVLRLSAHYAALQVTSPPAFLAYKSNNAISPSGLQSSRNTARRSTMEEIGKLGEAVLPSLPYSTVFDN